MNELEKIRKFVEDVKTIQVSSYAHENSMDTLKAINKSKEIRIEAMIASFLGAFSIERLLQLLAQSSGDGGTVGTQDIVEKVKVLSNALEILLRHEKLIDQIGSHHFCHLLQSGINSEHFDIRKICVRKLERSGLNSFRGDDVLNLLPGVFLGLCDPEATIANATTRMLLQYSRAGKEEALLIILKELNTLSDQLYQISIGESKADGNKDLAHVSRVDASTYLLRVTYVVCKLSQVNFDQVASSKALDVFVAILKSDDVLLQMNVINQVPLLVNASAECKAAEGSEGLAFLKSAGIVQTLLSMVASPLLKDYALKVLAYLSYKEMVFLAEAGQSDNMQGQDSLAPKVFALLRNEFDSTRPKSVSEVCSTLKIIGSLAGAVAGVSLELVFSADNFPQTWMESINTSNREQIRVTGIDSLSRALEAGTYNFQFGKEMQSLCPLEEVDVAQSDRDIFARKENTEYKMNKQLEKTTQQSSELCRKLAVMYFESYKANSPTRGKAANVVERLLQWVEIADTEHQRVSLKLLRMIALQRDPWGLESLVGNQKAMALLFNRSLRLDKIAKEWRFGVVEAMKHHPEAKNLLSEELAAKLDEFLVKGPFVGPTGTAGGIGENPAVIVETL